MKMLQYPLLLLISLILVTCSYKSPTQVSEVSESFLNDSILKELEISINNKSRFECELLYKNSPGDTPVIFAKGKVSIGKENGAITFSSDGKELWFGRKSPPRIYFIKKIGDEWSEPELAPFSGKYSDLHPQLSPDGKKLVFSSDRPIKKGEKLRKKKDAQLWECRKMQAGWTEPRNIGAVVNFGMFHICPTLSAKGSLFYNLGIHTKDSSFLDIYESKYIYNTFAKPQCLSLSINSASLDYAPFIAKDESYIIFASKRHGYGQSDLFISYKKSNGSWTKAINMGPNINSAENEDFPSVSPDGKYLFFNRTQWGNNQMLKYIFWVSADILEKLKPNYLRKIRSEKEKNL